MLISLRLVHVLALDAAFVAVAWLELAARSVPRVRPDFARHVPELGPGRLWPLAEQAAAPLPWVYPVLVGLAVFVAYLGDRVIDGLRYPRDREWAVRHAFARRQRFWLLPLVLLAVAFGLVLAYGSLPLRRIELGAGAAALLLLHLGLAQRWPRWFRRRLPREVVVGSFFAGALGLVLWPWTAVSARGELLTALALLGGLCVANAHAVARAEASADRGLGVESFAQQLPARLRSDLLAFAAVLVATLAIPTPLRPELAAAAAAELVLFALPGNTSWLVPLADVPLYAVPCVSLFLRAL